jgi:serine O-acetyltransferase
MIKSKKDYFFYKEADRILSGREERTLCNRLKLFLVPDPVGEFMRLLRAVEYYQNCPTGIFGKLKLHYFKYRFRKISLKLSFSIPANIFGPGLFIPHYGTITINSRACVGANCVLHTCVCITAKEQIIIGDNVYISTGSIIAGNIEINDNVTVGANSLVNKSFNETNVLIGGSPAKVIMERKAWFLEDGKDYEQRIIEINELKNKLYK